MTGQTASTAAYRSPRGRRRRPRNRPGWLRLRNLFVGGAAAAAISAGVVLAPTAQAAESPFERGPAPSAASITAANGPFDIDETVVRRSQASGFGGGTIFFPTSTTEGTFGGVVIAPGFTARQSSMAWLAPRLASQGFVVFNIDTNTTTDQPASRGRQMLAALDFLTQDSPVQDRVDADRLAVIGHSMGGGGALEAADARPELRAAIPLTPWNLTKNWSDLQVPTMIIGAERDGIASVRRHSERFHASFPDDLESAYLELRGASHFAPNIPNATIASSSVAWLKRFVDDDLRYEQFLCPPPADDRAFSEYIDSCPLL